MEPTLITLAINFTKTYVLSAIDEESHRTDPDISTPAIHDLRSFCTDVKSSDRFVKINSTREIHEVYSSVTVTPYMQNFIHHGATFLIFSLGAEAYSQMVTELSLALQVGYRKSMENQQTINGSSIIPEISRILVENPWLVFCILSRYAWFSEPKKPE